MHFKRAGGSGSAPHKSPSGINSAESLADQEAAAQEVQEIEDLLVSVS